MKRIRSLFLLGIFTAIASLSSTFVYAESAKEAWAKLVGEKFIKRPEFVFLENNEQLPNVLLYGDSVSIHYTEAVRDKLASKANIYRLHRNGGDSASFIRNMKKMHSTMQNPSLDDAWSFNWDIIHFNVGLHDLKYLKGRKLDKANGKQVNSIEQYENNLRNVVSYLKEISPTAKLIFATTTPIPAGELGRIVGDTAKYNLAALKVMKDFPEVIINDLYKFTKPNHSTWWTNVGNVHYNKIGSKAQGSEVARMIFPQLKLQAKTYIN